MLANHLNTKHEEQLQEKRGREKVWRRGGKNKIGIKVILKKSTSVIIFDHYVSLEKPENSD